MKIVGSQKLALVVIAIMFMFSVQGYNEGVPTNVGIGTTNLIAYWTFNANNVSDWGSFSAISYVATINTTGGANSRLGGSVYFDGADDYINYTKDVLPLNKPWTYAWWGRAADTTGIGYWLSDSSGSTALTYFRLSSVPNDVFDGGVENATSFAGFAGSGYTVKQNLTQLGLLSTDFQFYTVKINSSGHLFTYINSANQLKTSGKINVTGNPITQLVLGNRADLARDLKGWIDELMIFNIDLSSTTLTTLYNDQLLGIRPYSNLSTVTSLLAPSLDNQSIYVTWTNPTDSAFNHTHIFYNKTGSPALVQWGTSTSTSTNITGLTPSTIYNIFIYSSAHNNMNTTVGAYIINTTTATSEGSTPSLAGSNISFNTTFDSGSLSSSLLVANYTWNMTFKEDYTGCTGYDQCTTWFYFQMLNYTAQTNISFLFKNWHNASGGYWLSTSAKPYYSCDINNTYNWTRATTTRANFAYDSTHQMIQMNISGITCNNPYIAAWIPHENTKETALISFVNQTSLSNYVNWTNFSNSPGGRPLYEIRITNESISDSRKTYIVVIDGLHSSETYGSFLAEGMIRFLLNLSDINATQLLNSYVFYFYPHVNNDGRYLGFNRRDNNSVDLNRAWGTTTADMGSINVNATKLRILAINQTQNISLLIDSHGSGGGATNPYIEIGDSSYPANFLLMQTSFTDNISAYSSFDVTNDNTMPSCTSNQLTARAWGLCAFNYSVLSFTFEYTQLPTRSAGSMFADGRNLSLGILSYYGQANLSNQPPVWTQNPPNISVYWNESWLIVLNATDPDNATAELAFYVNDTRLQMGSGPFPNYLLESIIDWNQSSYYIGNWSVLVSVNDGQNINDAYITLEIKNTTNPIGNNTPPTISVDVRPNNATNETDLYCYVTVTDPDNATTLVEYVWYNGTDTFLGEMDLLVTTGVETLMNITRYTNLGVGDVWNCTAYAWDGMNASAYISDKVTISAPPTMGAGILMAYIALSILMGSLVFIMLRIGLNMMEEHFPLKIFLIWVAVLLFMPILQLAVRIVEVESIDSYIISMLTILQYAVTLIAIITTFYIMVQLLQYYLMMSTKRNMNPLRTQ